MLQKRIHKLLIISVMMVLSILVMAFLFIDHGDDSLNHATYTTMNQEIDLCTQRISSQNHTDLVLLNTLAKSLSNSADIDSSLAEMEKENAFTSISYMDSQRGSILRIHLYMLNIMNYQKCIKVRWILLFWVSKVHLYKNRM